MDNLKKSIVSAVVASVLMITDFDIELPTEQINALDSQQSLATLTAFSGWSLGLNEAEAGCADNNSCNEEFDTMVIIGDPIDDGWGDWGGWGDDPYPGDGDGNGNDGGSGGSGDSGGSGEGGDENVSVLPPEPFHDKYTCQRSATIQKERCNTLVDNIITGELFVCGVWGAFNPVGGVACAAFALTTIQVSYAECSNSYLSADNYCLANYPGNSGGSGAPGGGKTAP